MDFAKNNGSMILVLVMAFSGLCYGAVYKVGDGHGWTGRGVDYNAWAATKSFHVGDVISQLSLIPLHVSYKVIFFFVDIFIRYIKLFLCSLTEENS